MNEQYCNNCGKKGHLYHQCKLPITSIGIIVFRIHQNVIQYLMIRRKDTLGYIDFMRGKYSIYNKDYIMNMLKQMTVTEKNNLRTLSFHDLWIGIWGTKTLSGQYKSEELISSEKISALRGGVVVNGSQYTLHELLDESDQYSQWSEAEWGFPKGRRNYQEKDFECALREFAEETGYKIEHLHNVQNVLPFEEIFTGSNYKSYKHKYYLTFMNYKHTEHMENFEPTEVSKMEWKTYEECMRVIRPYNLEKKTLITNIHETLKMANLVSL